MRRRRAKSAVTLGTVVHQSPKQTQPSNKLYENRQTSHQQDRDRGHFPRHSQLNNNFILHAEVWNIKDRRRTFSNFEACDRFSHHVGEAKEETLQESIRVYSITTSINLSTSI
jgi:hypothetical protein